MLTDHGRLLKGRHVLGDLPPHLREVCAILAAGLVRLRRRRQDRRDAGEPGADGERSLHFTARPERSCEPGPTGEPHDPPPRRPADIASHPARPGAGPPGRPARPRPRRPASSSGASSSARSRRPTTGAYLESRLAYRIQELAYGGLKPETRARLEALGEQLDGGNVVLRRIRADSRPLAGTRLIREYEGVAARASRSAPTTSSTRAGPTSRSPPSPAPSPARAGTAGPSSGCKAEAGA